MGGTNGFLGEQTGDKKICDNVCLCRCKWFFCPLYGHETPCQRGDLREPPFPGVAAFSQEKEALRRRLSTSVESQMSLA